MKKAQYNRFSNQFYKKLKLNSLIPGNIIFRL